ncbi:hypothetical protein FKM82_028595 [Ascaphus truei]
MVAGPGIGALMFSEAYVWLTDLTEGTIILHKDKHINLQHETITTNTTNMQTISISPIIIFFPNSPIHAPNPKVQSNSSTLSVMPATSFLIFDM